MIKKTKTLTLFLGLAATSTVYGMGDRELVKMYSENVPEGAVLKKGEDLNLSFEELSDRRLSPEYIGYFEEVGQAVERLKTEIAQKKEEIQKAKNSPEIQKAQQLQEAIKKDPRAEIGTIYVAKGDMVSDLERAIREKEARIEGIEEEWNEVGWMPVPGTYFVDGFTENEGIVGSTDSRSFRGGDDLDGYADRTKNFESEMRNEKDLRGRMNYGHSQDFRAPIPENSDFMESYRTVNEKREGEGSRTSGLSGIGRMLFQIKEKEADQV